MNDDRAAATRPPTWPHRVAEFPTIPLATATRPGSRFGHRGPQRARVAESLRRAVAALRDRAGAPWGVTASVGAALLPDRPRPAEVTASLRDTGVAAPDVAGLVGRIEGAIRETVRFDAQAAARTLFGDAMPANLLVVGAAYQAGALPVSASAIEWAIELNGVAVGLNVAAFRWGRAAVADPAAFAAATGGAPAGSDCTTGCTRPRSRRSAVGGRSRSGRGCGRCSASWPGDGCCGGDAAGPLRPHRDPAPRAGTA